MPERYQAEGILDAVNPEAMRGKRVLIPRAAEAREVLPETLRAWGAMVDVVIAYRTVIPATPIGAARRFTASRAKVDVITFTSSSTVRNFVQLFGNRRLGEIVGRQRHRLHRSDYRADGGRPRRPSGYHRRASLPSPAWWTRWSSTSNRSKICEQTRITLGA